MESKRVYKSRTDIKIDGVCSGIAKYLNTDPTIVRLIWVLVACTGTGILAYIICMLIIPREPEISDYNSGGYNN